jgi:hypothetical protein
MTRPHLIEWLMYYGEQALVMIPIKGVQLDSFHISRNPGVYIDPETALITPPPGATLWWDAFASMLASVSTL